MRCRLLSCGDVAVLAELEGVVEVLALHAALQVAPPQGLVDLVPAARTLLVSVDRPARLDRLRSHVAAIADSTTTDEPVAEAQEPELVVPTMYDGADLDEVARLTGLTAGEVIEAHTATTWRVAFTGFAPGFGYLCGGDPRLLVPRRSEPRIRVPAGSVGLAGEFSGVYPRESPGGWQLLGRTHLSTWDEAREPPALMTPGRIVRFEQVGP